MPRVAGRSTLFASAVDISHGVCAALNMGAAEEGPAIQADGLHPSKY